MEQFEQVILVDDSDREIGVAEKLAAHRDGGRLHRAFSIFLFDREDRLLLQRRADTKYHFAGRWSNTCCGHPRPGERVAEAAVRRLREEFGINAALTPVTTLVYRATDPATELVEHEFLHVLRGRSDAAPRPNPDEIGDFRRQTLAGVDATLAEAPEQFTPWFPIALAALRRADGAAGAAP